MRVVVTSKQRMPEAIKAWLTCSLGDRKECTFFLMADFHLLIIMGIEKMTMSLCILLTIAFPGAVKASQTIPCTVCRDGESVKLPNKLITGVPSMPGELTCGQIDLLVPSIYPDDTHADCLALQSLGSLCGCQTPENACSLCEGGVPMAYPNRPLDFFSDMFGSVMTPDCNLVDAFLRMSHIEGDATCSVAQSFLGEYCECIGSITSSSASEVNSHCSICDDGSSITLPDRALNIEGLPLSTCGQLDEAVSTLFTEDSDQCLMFQSISSLCGCPARPHACNFCPDGGSMVYPDKPVKFLKETFGGIVPSCEIYEAYAQTSLNSDSDECRLVQATSGFCGCPAKENHCLACGDDEVLQPEFEEVLIDERLLPLIGMTDSRLPITCELMVSMQYQLSADDNICMLMQSRQDICGCNNGVYRYIGADTNRKKAVLSWLPRVSGTLSLIGALCIVFDVFRNTTKRGQMYFQLMASMSTLDALSSCAWIMSTGANDVDDPWPVHGEIGTKATCTAQGFFIQLTVASLLYNVSLSTYYFMTVVLAWRRDKLQAAKKYLHAVPLIIGLSLAFAGIPFYSGTATVCSIPTPPRAESWVPAALLQLVPVFTSLILCTMMVFPVWFKVHQHTADSRRQIVINKDTIPYDQALNFRDVSMVENAKLKRFHAFRQAERAVMWQAILYVSAIYTSWIAQIVVNTTWQKLPQNTRYSLVLVVMFMLPLQGFMNACNYFRPRIGQYLQRRSPHHTHHYFSSNNTNNGGGGGQRYQDEQMLSEQHRAGSLVESDLAVILSERLLLVDPCAYLEEAPLYENLSKNSSSPSAVVSVEDSNSKAGDIGSTTRTGIDCSSQIPEESRTYY